MRKEEEIDYSDKSEDEEQYKEKRYVRLDKHLPYSDDKKRDKEEAKVFVEIARFHSFFLR